MVRQQIHVNTMSYTTDKIKRTSMESTCNNTNFNGSNITMDKYTRMRSLTQAIQIYLKTRSKDQIVDINQHLQALSLTLDLSIFDPHTIIAGNFYISLFDLMHFFESSLESSLTSWYCIDMLLKACENNTARETIVTTYNFLPCLSRMLSEYATADKKKKLLRLMQIITCGVKLPWTVPNMSSLLMVLCKWIEKEDQDICALALGVLVNLCRNNVTSLHILQRNVDLKKFMKTLLGLRGPIVEVYVWHSSIILEAISGNVPSVFLEKSIDSTFTAIKATYQRKDHTVLKQVVELFIEYIEKNCNLLTEYKQYDVKIEATLELIEKSPNANSSRECLCYIMRFINFLIENKANGISALYPRIISLCLKWTQENTVSFEALALLRTVVVNIDRDDNELLKPLVSGIDILLLMINSTQEDNIIGGSENIKRFGALLQLLTAILHIKPVCSRVSMELNENQLKYLFIPLLGEESPRLCEDTSSKEMIALYIYALTLIKQLGDIDHKWTDLLNNLLERRQLHVVIAQAIVHKSPGVIKLALQLASICSEGVALTMANLSPEVCHNLPSQLSGTYSNDMSSYIIPMGLYERLQTLLENLENIIMNCDAKDLPISKVMEVYNNKLSYMSHTERDALSSLEALIKHNTHLQHKISRLTSEINRLQQSEIATMQQLECMTSKNKEITAEKNKLKNCMDAERERLTKHVADIESALHVAETALQESNAKFEELNKVFVKVKEQCMKLEKIKLSKEETIKSLTDSNKNVNMKVQQLEKCLKEKEQSLDETRKILQTKSAILENITKMANSNYM